MMKILILVPSFKLIGGVSNHYIGLLPHWKNQVTHVFYGKRSHCPAIFSFFPDLIIFIYRLICSKIDIVIVNPSLRKYQLLRDGLYLLLAKLFRKKIITFIHGWDENIFKSIVRKPKLFCLIYGKSHFIYVLCSDFKKGLDNIPLRVPVLLSTTKVSDSLLTNFNINEKQGNIRKILYLARAEKSKGLIITIKSFALLKKKYPYLKLSICGSGNALQQARDYVLKEAIAGISFLGNVSGIEKREQLKSSDLYILPTSGEGMATSILEAMAFGLVIISRPVGGVKDFFLQEQMGYLIESLEPEDYSKHIEYFINNPDKTLNISRFNHFYACNHFLASQVAQKIEKDIAKYCS